MSIQGELNRLIEQNTKDLKQNINLRSIFLVGSMASNNYHEKDINDYDIRFILSYMNCETYKEILDILEKIKFDILDKGIGCEISTVIGPVKIEKKKKKNVLIHSIIMTEKELEDLSNIHKKSYSANYKMLYGEDIVDKYKDIVLTPKDIIDSVEGIEYCIDCIKNRKLRYSKWFIEQDTMLLKQEEVEANNNEMIELMSYSYNKSLNNINNMIKTNIIKKDLLDYIEYTPEEKELIRKIESNCLVDSDINNYNVNIIIKILYKLEKGCLQVYNAKTKFYNSLEWGIVNEESKKMRQNGFDFLKKINVPTGDNFSISYQDYQNQKQSIESRINNSKYIVILEPPTNQYHRYGLTGVNSTRTIDAYMEQEKLSLKSYNISFIEIIKELEDSFSGTVISNGKGDTFIEIIKGTCDSRELTSTGADPNRIKQYNFFSFEGGERAPQVIYEIKKVCQYFKGYYEFAFGEIRGEKDIYFTFYSPNENYINIFKGGRIR